MALKIRSVASEAEREAVRGLLRAGFEVRPGLGEAFVGLYDHLLNLDPSVDPEGSRIAVLDGTVVGHALLAPRRFFISGTTVPGGIVAMVVVAPDQRGKGVGRALVEDIEGLAARMGLTFLQVAGDLGYYRRLGYVDAYQGARSRMPTRPGSPGKGALRPIRQADPDRLAEISQARPPTGSVHPTPERWRWFMATGHPFGLIQRNETMLGTQVRHDVSRVLELSGEAVGYVLAAAGEESLAVYEAAVLNLGESGVLLGRLHDLAASLGCRWLDLVVPRDCCLVEAASRSGGQVEVGVDSGLLTKVLAPASLLKDLTPVLTRRLAASTLLGREASIAFDVEGDVTRVWIEGAAVRVSTGSGGEPGEWRISLPGIGLARAVLGTEGLAVLAERHLAGSEPLRGMLDVLFPAVAPETG